MKCLDDYVMVIDDIMQQHVVDALLNEYKTSDAWMEYAPGKSGGNTPGTHVLLSHPAIIQNSPARQKILGDINKYIFEGFDQYHKKHSRREQGVNYLMIKEMVGLRLIKYEQGQSLDKHTDRYTYPNSDIEIWPVVTFTITLNEDYSGGELDLLDGDHVYIAKSRQCVFFPANFLYPHAVYPVKCGTRYSLVGWFV